MNTFGLIGGIGILLVRKSLFLLIYLVHIVLPPILLILEKCVRQENALCQLAGHQDNIFQRWGIEVQPFVHPLLAKCEMPEKYANL
jgi:hypothetical protein